MSEFKQNFSWENTQEKYPINTSKKSLPIFYDFYDLSKDFLNVYEPSEDTFLLIDSLELEIENLFLNNYFKNLEKITSIELGCGNGLVSCCFLSKLKSLNINKKVNHYCVDINKHAINLTKGLLTNYDLDKDTSFIESNLFDNIDKNEIFDIIIFNPPYVTTDKEEYERALKEKDIYAAWAGGNKGSETIHKFVKELNGKISDKGIIFLLLSKENDYNLIINNITTKYNMNFELLMRKQFKNEKLAVFKFYKIL